MPRPPKKKRKDTEMVPGRTGAGALEPADEEIDHDAVARGDVPMSIVDHLDELRTRTIICLAAFLLVALTAFFFSDEIIAVITDPMTQFGQRLNIFKLAGGILLRIKVAIFTSIIISMPLVLFQIWRFVVPAVSIQSRLFSRISVIAASMFFYSGAAFVFFILLPFALRILLRLIGTEYVSTIGADDYLDFLLYFSISMGFLFEFPIAVILLTRTGLLTPYTLRSKRKYSYILIWIVAAIITPEDLLSQILVAIPLMLLYEASIAISRLVVMRKKKQELKNS